MAIGNIAVCKCVDAKVKAELVAMHLRFVPTRSSTRYGPMALVPICS